MPELPEVETVRSALAPVVTGQQVTDVFVGRKDLRWPLPEALDSQLLGRQLKGRRFNCQEVMALAMGL